MDWDINTSQPLCWRNAKHLFERAQESRVTRIANMLANVLQRHSTTQ